MKSLRLLVLVSMFPVVTVKCDTVSVFLKTPDYPIIKDEVFPISVSVSNMCKQCLYVGKNPGSVMNWQMFFTVFENGKVKEYDSVFHAPNAFFWSQIQRDHPNILQLVPGESYTLDFSDVFPVGVLSTNVQLSVQMLVGNHEWAYSNTNTLQILGKKTVDGVRRFEGVFPYATGIDHFAVYQHTLGNRDVLFTDLGYRIVDIPYHSTPCFNMNTNSGVLTVSFGTNAPPVRYHIPTCKVLPPAR